MKKSDFMYQMYVFVEYLLRFVPFDAFFIFFIEIYEQANGNLNLREKPIYLDNQCGNYVNTIVRPYILRIAMLII